jgi:hypothetical protein
VRGIRQLRPNSSSAYAGCRIPIPVHQRLKRFLKMAIRGYGLVCTHHEEIKPAEDKPREPSQ